MHYLYLLLIAIIPPVLIALYLYFRDKYVKEPLTLLVKSFFLGWLIVLPILAIHYGMEQSGVTHVLSRVFKPDTLWDSIWQSFFMAALLEEGFKYLAFRKWIWNNRHFDEYYDGILYAALISLGFATLENIFYVMEFGYGAGWSRAVTAIPAHGFFGVAMGYYFSRARFDYTHTGVDLFLAFLIPFLLHGLYDVVVFEIARFDDPSHPFFYWVVLSFWLLMIGMLIWSRRRIRILLRKDSQ